MEEQRRGCEKALPSFETETGGERVEDDDGQRGEKQRREAQHLKRFAERFDPRSAPHDLGVERRRRKRSELEVAGPREGKRRETEVPVVIERKVAARIDDRNRDREDQQQ